MQKPAEIVARDIAAVMREDTNELRLWREAAQMRRGIQPPIDPQKNERLTPEGNRLVAGRTISTELREERFAR